MTCTVTGVAKRPDGSAYANATFTAIPSPATVAAFASEAVFPVPVTFTSDAGGNISVSLFPGNYACTDVATGRRFDLGVQDEAAANWADCIDAMSIMAWPDAVRTVLEARDAILALQDFVTVNPPSAGQLIAAATEAKATMVTLRQVLGTGYTVAQDGAAILNAVLPTLAAAGIGIYDREGITLSLQSSLEIPSGLHADLADNTTFVRQFGGTLAMVRNIGGASPTIRAVGVHWRGGRFICEDDDFGGHMWIVGLDDSKVEGLQILGFRRNPSSGGHGLRLWGDRNTFLHPHILSETLDVGTAGIRIIGGHGNIVHGARVRSGDDALQFVPATDDPANAFYGMPISDSIYSDCYVESASKGCIAAISSSVSTSTGAPGVLQRVSFKGIRGTYGTNAVLISNDAGDSAIDGQVDWVLIDDVCLSKGPASSIGVSHQAINIATAWEGGVRNVVVRNTVIDATTFDGSGTAMAVRGPGIRVHGGSNSLKGRIRALRLTGGAIDVTAGGDFVAGSEGLAGDEDDRHVIQIDTLASGSTLRLASGSRVMGVSTPTLPGGVTPMSGIFVGAGSRVIAGDLTVTKASGAGAGTKAFQTGAGASVRYDSLATDCDVVESGAGDAMQAQYGPGAGIAPTIITTSANSNFAVADLPGDVVFLDGTLTRSPTYNLVNTGAGVGVRRRLYRRDTTAFSITITTAAGATTLGTLTAADQWLDVIFDGTAWAACGSN